MLELVGVGHICKDHLCIVRSYPPEDSSTRILSIHHQGGGAAATAVVAAARLGVRAGVIGNLGDDETGADIADELEREGVDVSLLEHLPNTQSLLSYIMIDPKKGTRTKFPMLDEIPPIEWGEAKREVLRQARILHLDGTNYANAIAAAQLAKSYGVTISLDGCTRQSDNSLNRELASLADVLITNSEYPIAVTGKSTVEAALLEMSGWGPQVVACTVGADGVFLVIDGRVRHFPAQPTVVVDTTGAGDVFHGAFVAAQLRGKDLEHSIEFAQYVAAAKCSQIGGREGIPNWETAEQHYRRPGSRVTS